LYLKRSENKKNVFQSYQGSTIKTIIRAVANSSSFLTQLLDSNFCFRLMLSSPLFGSPFFTRTNSGRSNISLQTFNSPFIPQQQPLVKPVTQSNVMHQPIVAWGSSPANRELPPVKRHTIPGQMRPLPAAKQWWDWFHKNDGVDYHTIVSLTEKQQ